MSTERLLTVVTAHHGPVHHYYPSPHHRSAGVIASNNMLRLEA